MRRIAATAQPLLRSIGVRLAMVAAGLIGVITLLTILEFTGDVGKLRRATLEREANRMLASLREGGLSDFPDYCKRYPEAYGFRIFNEKNELLDQINGDLFSGVPSYRNIGPPYLAFRQKSKGDPANDQWLLSRGGDGKGGPWLQMTLVGDPAALSREIIIREIIDHVAIPMLVIIPPLSLAIFLALRSVLRPLSRIAEQARTLACEVGAGGPLHELRVEALPKEALDLVTATNVLLQKIEATLADQKQFAENAAHELRTPLSALRLQISCLPSNEPIERLKSDIAVMCRLVDQLLRLARAEQLARDGFRAHDLREVTRAACEELALLAATQGRLMEFHEPSTPVFVSCNAEFVQMAIRNIIENALRVAPTGSNILIFVNEAADVEVSDRGPGIPDAEKPLVFQRFWMQRRRNGEGAGIGLALVRRIMDIHGGAIRVADRVGGGARITLSFTITGCDAAAVRAIRRSSPENIDRSTLRASFEGLASVSDDAESSPRSGSSSESASSRFQPE